MMPIHPLPRYGLVNPIPCVVSERSTMVMTPEAPNSAATFGGIPGTVPSCTATAMAHWMTPNQTVLLSHGRLAAAAVATTAGAGEPVVPVLISALLSQTLCLPIDTNVNCTT